MKDRKTHKMLKELAIGNMGVTIIYTYSFTGQNLEYLSHLYRICTKRIDRKYIFLIPEQFRLKFEKVNLREVDNVKFDFISIEEQKRYKGKSLWKFQYNTTKILAERIHKHNADKCFCMFLSACSPFGIILLPYNVKVSGIIYDIYLYRKKSLSFRSKIKEHILALGLSLTHQIKTVFVLNDENSAYEFNRIYKSRKFQKLADPFPEIEVKNKVDLFESYPELKGKKIFIHFGGLAERKGTLDILQSIKNLSLDEQQKYAFVFAGRVGADIRKEFYKTIDELEGNITVVIKDEFCSYDFIDALCRTATAILMPYYVTDRSSGMLGYASYYGIPVIAPSEGLIGTLVNTYKLGVTIKDITSDNIRNACEIVCKMHFKVDNRYYLDNSLEAFQTQIQDSL